MGMNLSQKELRIWDKARSCNCSDQDCSQNHKLCGLCPGTIIYGAHVSNQPTSRYAWNIDHIIPRFRGGSNSEENLQAVHVTCNWEKGNY